MLTIPPPHHHQKTAEVDAEADAIRAERARQGEVKTLPWECSEEQSIVAEDLMEKILSLPLGAARRLFVPACAAVHAPFYPRCQPSPLARASRLVHGTRVRSCHDFAEASSFVDEPTPPTQFDFDMERHVQIITKLLELDPNLSKVP